jgi:hypothetical protein
MAGQVSPGIVLLEKDLTTQTSTVSQNNVAVIASSFAKGPVGTITNITSEKQLYQTFGAPNNSNYEDWFTAASFLKYGGQLQVVRIQDTVLKNAASDIAAQTTDSTKLYVVNASGFTSGDYVKVNNEFFVIGTVTTSGSNSLAVTSRAQLGSASVNHSSGESVTKWTFALSGTSTTITNTITSTTEQILTLTSSTGFVNGSYFKITNSINGNYEYVLITEIEGNNAIVSRGQLGTTAIIQGGTLTATLLNFASAGTSTVLSQTFPVVTQTGVSTTLIKSISDYETNHLSDTWKFAARTAGTWCNGIQVAWIDGSVASYSNQIIVGSTKWSSVSNPPVNLFNGSTGTSDLLHIVVLDANNNILETFLNVSRNSSAIDQYGNNLYYPNIIQNKSQYIYAGQNTTLPSSGLTTINGGVDSYVTDVSIINTAFGLFSNTEEIQIDFILSGGSLNTIISNQIQKADYIINLASSRKDCLAFISPHNGIVGLSSSDQLIAITSFFGALTSSSYAIFDSGYKYIYDNYNNVYRYIPCNGDIAGLCTKTSLNNADWVSPAGTTKGNLINVIKLAYNPSKADRDVLYQASINPIVSFPGQGIILYGDKTAQGYPSAFDRINVRRLFINVEKYIGNLAKNVLFELNDNTTRVNFSNSANTYLSSIQSRNGVTGYLVVCDSTNNTPSVVDSNNFVAEIYIQPTRSINYITITFVATATGVTFNEITGGAG